MKIYYWICHIFLCFILIFLTAKYISDDPNMQLRSVDVTVVNTIQENNDDITTYYGVFKLPNGSMISKKISRVQYVSLSPGEEGTLKLSLYDTGDAKKDNVRNIVEEIMLLISFLYSFFGTVRMFTYSDKKKKE